MFCTRCGKESKPGATFCVGCGAPLRSALVPEVVPESQPSPGPAPRSSGLRAWHVIVAAAVIVVLVVGVVVGVLVMRSRGDDSDASHETTTSTSLSAGLGASSTTSEPAATTSTVPATSTTSTTMSPATTDDWPEFDGWTVIIESLDVADPASESTARTHAAEMVARGIEAGVLYSTGYRSLNPGYWAVFSGFFDTEASARSHMDWLINNGYPYAYFRQVTR